MKRVLSFMFSCVFVFMLALPCFFISASAVDDMTLSGDVLDSLVRSGYISLSSSFSVRRYSSDDVVNATDYYYYGVQLSYYNDYYIALDPSSSTSTYSASYIQISHYSSLSSSYPVVSGYTTIGITIDLSSYGIFYSITDFPSSIALSVGSVASSYRFTVYTYDVYCGSDLAISHSGSTTTSQVYHSSEGFTSVTYYIYVPSGSYPVYGRWNSVYISHGGSLGSLSGSSIYSDVSSNISSSSSAAASANEQLQEIEEQFIDSATEAFDDIDWDLELTSEMASSMSTVTDTMGSFWNSLGDFQYMIIFPLMLGIILLLAGRVSKSKSGGGG